MRRHYGKYPGTVDNNLDPDGLGRIQVTVPQFKGIREAWALPCVPYAGQGVGFYMVPPKGANVWVEFAGGDLDTPIWSGCFWDVGQVPMVSEVPPVPERKVIKTDGVTLLMSDVDGDGGVTLSVGPPATELATSITMGPTGITIQVSPDVKITLTEATITISVPPASVSVAEGEITIAVPESAVTVTPESVTAAVEPSTLAVTAESVSAIVETGMLNVTAEAVEASAATAAVVVSEAVIELSNDESNVSIFPVGVVINEGALEII